ncbi:MAG: 50S ribosomal protein L35, partial [Clostridia bacterium]|nr:50S ribosomal protein L35 [Clostridia bacterium]
KMKTHRGTAKRIKITGTGKFKRHHAYCSHKLGGKTMKRKRALRQSAMTGSADNGRLSKLLPYA